MRSAWTRGLHSYHGMRTTHSTGRHCTTATCPLATFTIRDSRVLQRRQTSQGASGKPKRLPSADRHAPPRNMRHAECSCLRHAAGLPGVPRPSQRGLPVFFLF
jgi:hypothetical protein